jgi:hypothetical protein
MARLELDALADIEAGAEEAEEADALQQAVDADPSPDDARFLNAKVRKVFADGTFEGLVKRHVILPEAFRGKAQAQVQPQEESKEEPAQLQESKEEAEDDEDDGERWLVEFSNGRQQLVRPQELLDILVGDDSAAAAAAAAGGQKKASDPLASDPYIGRQVRPPTADDPDMGTIVRVVLKKVQGKKKRVRVYTIEWRNPQGGVEFTRDYERFEFMPFLVPEGAS